MATVVPSSVDAVGDSSTQKQKITVGTRRSHLARVQTDIVVESLRKAYPEYDYEVQVIDPLADRDQLTALYSFNAKSLWTFELEEKLIDGGLDAAVHSLKDMPTQLPVGLGLGSIFPREDPRDALVVKPSALPQGSTTQSLSADSILSSLPADSIIGTSSLRRIAQLRRRYPHLKFESVRGNIGTRLRKLDDPSSFTDQVIPNYAALVLAAAGLIRVGWGDRITAYLSSKDGGVLHAVGQGALGVEIREGDQRIGGMLEKLGCFATERACLAERSLMRTLEGGCSVPIGVESEWTSGVKDELTMRAVVVSVDGTEFVETEEKMTVKTREDADEFGRVIAKVLVEKGADKILAKINLDRGIIAEQGGA